MEGISWGTQDSLPALALPHLCISQRMNTSKEWQRKQRNILLAGKITPNPRSALPRLHTKRFRIETAWNLEPKQNVLTFLLCQNQLSGCLYNEKKKLTTISSRKRLSIHLGLFLFSRLLPIEIVQQCLGTLPISFISLALLCPLSRMLENRPENL